MVRTTSLIWHVAVQRLACLLAGLFTEKWGVTTRRLSKPQWFVFSTLAALTILATQRPGSARAATYYWDTNGSSTGCGTGIGDWGGNNWSTNYNGTIANTLWQQGSDAVFSAGNDKQGVAYGIDVSSYQDVRNITTEDGNVSLNGSGSGILSITASGGATWLTDVGTTLNVNCDVRTNYSAGLSLYANGAVTISGAIGSGVGFAGNLWKTGSSTLTLTGDNTYTGNTYIDNGTLILSSAANNISSSPIINVRAGATLDVSGVTGFALASGQTLKGNGTVIGAMTIGNGMTLSPGQSPGTMTFDTTHTWAGGGTYLWEVDKIAVGSQASLKGTDVGYDFTQINGALDITSTSGSKFKIDITGLVHPGHSTGIVDGWNNTQPYTWVIASATGGIAGFSADKFDLLSTHFAGANSLGGGSFSISQDGNNVNLNFSPVPEPGTLVLLGCGLLALLAYAWRHRR